MWRKLHIFYILKIQNMLSNFSSKNMRLGQGGAAEESSRAWLTSQRGARYLGERSKLWRTEEKTHQTLNDDSKSAGGVVKWKDTKRMPKTQTELDL